MSRESPDPAAGRGWQGLVEPMEPRSPGEAHRAATPLELFFDLVFVVAIAEAASRFHHSVAEAHAARALLDYTMVFFAIWWAWMNFTWFASAYDTDDVAYRLVVFVQLTGALVLAAGVGNAFDTQDFSVMTAGYVVMRIALVSQWLRAARGDPARRTTARRYAVGVGACQAGWVGFLFAPAEWLLPGFGILVTAELLVPVWAERAAGTPWHPGHIIERYGLFTIIVLGETILASSMAIRAAVQGEAFTGGLAALCLGGLLIVFSLWWLYFERPQHDLRASLGTGFVWGYGHLPIFASAAAVGAGIGVAVDHQTGHAAIGQLGAGLAVAAPVAIFLLCLWALHARPARDGPMHLVLTPVVAGLVLLTPLTGQATLLTGLLSATLLTVKLLRRARASVPAGA